MINWTSETLIGGHSALDFINTVDDKEKSRTENRIADWQSFVSWCRVSELFSDNQLDLIFNIEDVHTQRKILADLHVFREYAYCAFCSIADRIEGEPKEYKQLRNQILLTMSRSNMVLAQGCFEWKIIAGNRDWIIDKFVLAVDELLRSTDLRRLKQCGRCTWLFLDKGRGRGRRWCDMNTCGNREKSRKFRSGC